MHAHIAKLPAAMNANILQNSYEYFFTERYRRIKTIETQIFLVFILNVLKYNYPHMPLNTRTLLHVFAREGHRTSGYSFVKLW